MVLARAIADHGDRRVAAAAELLQLGGDGGGIDGAHVHHQSVAAQGQTLPIDIAAIGLAMACDKGCGLGKAAVGQRYACVSGCTQCCGDARHDAIGNRSGL